MTQVAMTMGVTNLGQAVMHQHTSGGGENSEGEGLDEANEVLEDNKKHRDLPGPLKYLPFVCDVLQDLKPGHEQDLSDNWIHGHLNFTIFEGRDFKSSDYFSENDMYAVIWAGENEVHKTKVWYDDDNPKWNSNFNYYICACADELTIKVLDADDKLISENKLGSVAIPYKRLLRSSQSPIEEWLEMDDAEGEIYVKYQFTPLRRPSTMHLRGSYFKPTEGNRVTLFQCSTCEPGRIPTVQHKGGSMVAPSLWEDLREKILQAQKLIYITGWSVWVNLKLHRRMGPKEETLGELLKMKADQGVAVKIMQWDDVTSIRGAEKAGMMDTHDEETLRYFQGSRVLCHLCKRQSTSEEAEDKLGLIKSVIFTHHQKTVNLDCEGRLIAYVGGLDLTCGRYSTPDHSLFRTLRGEHGAGQTSIASRGNQPLRMEKGKPFPPADYSQNMVVGSEVNEWACGPKEPWQDLHGRLEGPIARDVYQNFVERWKKQVAFKYLEESERSPPGVDPIIEMDDIEKMGLSCAPVEQGPNAWTCQLYRSIDDICAELVAKSDDKNYDPSHSRHWFERSIQMAYVHAIRRAERFIYIENQYFMGSSHCWVRARNGCENLLPVEIAWKCAQMIQAKRKFHAYINVPMWPEGPPDSGSVQEILHWQFRTVEMMYQIIAIALKRAKSRAHPKEYLTFYTLVNREADDPDYSEDENFEPALGSDAAMMFENRRAPIYIHSKYMCVDDEWMIMGSANINERSQNGKRDSEIAYGAWQPGLGSNGGVQAYRMQIWANHLGIMNPGELEAYRNPQDPRVLKMVQKSAKSNWKQYTAKKNNEMIGHLVPFPYWVSKDGELEGDADGYAVMVDTNKGLIKGKSQTMVPDIISM